MTAMMMPIMWLSYLPLSGYLPLPGKRLPALGASESSFLVKRSKNPLLRREFGLLVLDREQRSLDLEAPRVAPDAAAGVPDAVTRDHDRHRVRPERVARRPRAARGPGARRDLAVREPAAVRDRPRRLEHATPERRPHELQLDRHREVAPAPREVLVELAAHRVEPRRGLDHPRR